MTPERWQQLKQIFQSALERNPAERSAFLNRACADDPALRSEVESLIASHDRAGDSIEAMAAEAATEMIANDSAIVGKQIGNYRVLNRIGRGGMGEVFLAQDTSLGRKVALKLLRSDFTGNEERLRRFRQEARAASALNHPNILTIHEIRQEGSLHFMVTEFVEGETLREKILGPRMALGQVLDIAAQVASALAAAHNAGIVHRDIKPENVMMRTDGYVKVLDFGLAKLTERAPASSDSAWPTLAKVETNPGVVMGTVQYMSPEQARGLEVDARTDIFSLGLMLYEMVAGRVPFEGETPSDVIVSLLDKQPAPLSRYSPGVPTELQRIVVKSLCKDREERYQVVKDLLIDLKSLRDVLAFEAKLERSVPPEVSSRTEVSGTAGQTFSTDRQEAAHPTSRAGYLLTGIKQHKRVAIGALALLLIASVVAAFFYFKRAPALTEKDDILLTEFVNSTGDSVFDGTLKQALAVHLGQSPFLNIVADDRVRETLRRMQRSPDERITAPIGREICQREGIKAFLIGSIASLGSNYVITLEALNGLTGEAFASEQVEAGGKEQVITKLGEAATKLRERLGESMSSIQKFDTPLAQVTTSSLEALKAYTAGKELADKGKVQEAIPFFKHAIEIDPNFALGFLALASSHLNAGSPLDTIKQYATKAFELRERVTEREKLSISSFYYDWVIDDMERSIEVLELWSRTYPRDAGVRNYLANVYVRYGRFEKAVASANEGLRLDPNSAGLYANLVSAYASLGRFGEAKATYEQARARDLAGYWGNGRLYLIAFAEGDQAEMQRQIELAKGTPAERTLIDLQGWTAMFGGHYREASEKLMHVAELEQGRGSQINAANIVSVLAAWGAITGNCERAKTDTRRALAITKGVPPFQIAGIAPALCGDTSRARSIVDELARDKPTSTDANVLWGPLVRATIELTTGDSREAVRIMEKSRPFEMGLFAGYWHSYIRGLAYLKQGAATDSMAEFQKILDRPGIWPASVHIPLAHLGIARAAALAGDTAKSRKAYQDFFALWKDADPDVPILIEAKKEYEKLK